MPDTVIMMSNTQEVANLIGQPVKADGWYGHMEGLHTVVFNVINFTGRLFIEASLELSPTNQDWFPVKLGDTTDYLEFPRNPLIPTGNYETGGDTGSFGKTFRINALWLRARLDRTYLDPVLYELDPNALEMLGYVNKITLAR